MVFKKIFFELPDKIYFKKNSGPYKLLLLNENIWKFDIN